MSSGCAPSDPFRQSRTVWVVAFACVISFMGIRRVDPILPALAHLHATPSQVSLPFTSHLVVTTVMMVVGAAVAELLDHGAANGTAANGQIRRSVGDHAAAGRVPAQHADEIEARTVAVGRSPRGPASQFAEGGFTSALTPGTSRTVVLAAPDTTPHQPTAEVLPSLRGA